MLTFRRYTDGSLADGDNLGLIRWMGAEDEDGTYYSAAGIMAEVDEASWTDGTSNAGRLKLFTTADGETALSTALMLDSSQNATFYGDVTITGNDIKDSGGNTVLSFDGSGNIDNDVVIKSTSANLDLLSTEGEAAIRIYGDGGGMADGDNIGAIRFYGTENDGTNSAQVGYIICEVADSSFQYASSAGAMIKIGVVPDGTTTVDEILFIDGGSGVARVGINHSTPESPFHVYQGSSDGHGAGGMGK